MTWISLQIDPAKKGPKHLKILEQTHGTLPPTVTCTTPDGCEWRYFGGSANVSYTLANGLTIYPCPNPPQGVLSPAPPWLLSPPLPTQATAQASPAAWVDTTDLGNARRAANIFKGDSYRLVGTTSGWLSWDARSCIWRDDDTPVQKALRAIPQDLRKLAFSLPKQRQKALLAAADYAASERGLTAAKKLLESDPDVRIFDTDMAASPLVLQCGTSHVDLATGAVSPADKSRFFTSRTEVEPDFSGPPVVFLRFLDEITQGDLDLQTYFQTLFGYCLTGLNREQYFWFITGPKNNGKSTLLDIITYCMGGFAATASEQTFFSEQNGIRNDLAALRYARMVGIRELSPSTSINETAIRRWTSGEPLRARFLYREEFEFCPVGKLIVLTNHFPIIRGAATWRRVRIIPLTYLIPAASKNVNLGAHLKSEAPRILAWLIQGAMRYLSTPFALDQLPAVASAYEERKKLLVDPITSFLMRETLPAKGRFVPGAQLYALYRQHTERQGTRPYTYPSFIEALLEREVSVSGMPELVHDVMTIPHSGY